jgi:hypothetical protein
MFATSRSSGDFGADNRREGAIRGNRRRGLLRHPELGVIIGRQWQSSRNW